MMRGVNRKSIVIRALVAGAVGAAYGALFARYVTPRVFSPGVFAEDNLVLMALKYSPLVNALAKVSVAAIIALHCGLLRASSRKRSTREKLAAAAMGFAACLAATLLVIKFLN